MELTVAHEDTGYRLVDFAIGDPKIWPDSRLALNGHITLVLGNHDGEREIMFDDATHYPAMGMSYSKTCVYTRRASPMKSQSALTSRVDTDPERARLRFWAAAKFDVRGYTF